MVEHFEIDSSKFNRKGSEFKREDANISRKSKAFFNENNESRIFSSEINVKRSTECYLESLKDCFSNHYKKIDDYYENSYGLLEERFRNKEAKICFFIEDTTPLGNYISKDNDFKLVSPIDYKDFIDFLSEVPKVDYIFLSISEINQPKNYFFDNSEKTRNLLSKHCLKENKQLFNLHLMKAAAQISVPYK